jgi:hypothetical protein
VTKYILPGNHIEGRRNAARGDDDRGEVGQMLLTNTLDFFPLLLVCAHWREVHLCCNVLTRIARHKHLPIAQGMHLRLDFLSNTGAELSCMMPGPIELPDSEVEFCKFIARKLFMNEVLDGESKGDQIYGHSLDSAFGSVYYPHL